MFDIRKFKRRVKNYIEKFEGDDFMFELDDEEVEKLLRCKNFTLNKGRGSNINTNCMCLLACGPVLLQLVRRCPSEYIHIISQKQKDSKK